MALVVQHPSTAPKQKQSGITELVVDDSSFLQHLKYDAANLQLTVTMKTGAQYIHWYVYPMTFNQMIESPSKGEFYAKVIKGRNPSTRTISKNIGKKAPTKEKTDGRK